MLERRFIFLDIDGVLNSDDWYKYLFDTKPKSEIKAMQFNEYNIDPRATKLLNQLAGCEVIISSSWGYSADTCSGLINAGLELPIINGTNKLEIGHNWLTRGNSIFKWFDQYLKCSPKDYLFKDGWYEHNNIKLSYVIFDDDVDMLVDQLNHFIHINSWHGLTQSDINRAKSILNL